MKARQVTLYLILAALVVVSLFVGAADLAPVEVWKGLFGNADSITSAVVSDIRLPRVLGGVFLGVALGIGGIGLQASFRNNLAEPYLLGISSGAGLGLVVGALLQTSDVPFVPMVSAAISGVLAALLIRRLGHFTTSSDGLILTGVALNFVFLAWTLILIFAVDSPRLPTFVYFVFGSLATVTWPVLWIAVVLIAGALVVIAKKARALDLLSLGEDEASSLGIDVPKVVTVVLVSTGVATGASVAMAGVVGFVGLVASLVGRQLFGSSHRILIPATATIGAIFVLVSDTLIRGLFGQVEVPLGVVTAAIGGPLLVTILLRARLAR